MFVSCLLTVSLALAAGATPAEPATVWLVQPLYPGQDALVQRTESGIAALLPPETRDAQRVGRDALTAWLKGRRGDLRCVSGTASCREPLESYVASLGIERVVLVQGGQDDAGYRFRAVSVRTDTGARTQAEAANPVFEKALAGALVKFLSINATVEAVSQPSGATVFIDGVKMGTSPFTAELLPGEHTFRFELASHLPWEVTRQVGSREKVKVERALEKVPARLVVKAAPVGTEILVDGQRVGVNAVDQGIQPGTHVLTLTQEGYLPHEVQAVIQPGETFTLEQALKPTGMQSFKLAMRARQEATYDLKSYLEVSIESNRLTGSSVETRPVNSPDPLKAFRTQDVRAPGRQRVQGFGLEYGRYGKFFGVMLVGGSYYTTGDTWTLGVTVPDEAAGESVDAVKSRGSLDVKAQFLRVRALQPQLRWVVGPVALAAQAGLELQGVLLKERGEGQLFSDGLYTLDVHAMGQATLRVFLYEGLYASAAYQHSFSLTKNISGTSNFRGGFGYAF
ncbi:PEGA domain-containing protein [Corallococcus sp. H22C18031201]|nr:PEGA domain-containing protein [Corallococcus sp. H22C18031201]